MKNAPPNDSKTQSVGTISTGGVNTKVADTLNTRRFHSQVKISSEAPTHVTLRAFCTSDGLEFVSEMPANQDVVDVIAYRRVGDKILLATISTVRPGPLVHDAQSGRSDIIDHPSFIELPAGIIRADLGESALTDTAERVMRDKLGITSSDRIYHLGGVQSHSPGKTTELTYPIVIEVSEKTHADSSLTESGSLTQVQWRSLEDILGAYQTGDIQDTRLIGYVLELARRERYPLSLDTDIGSPIDHDSVPTGFQILDKGQLRSREHKTTPTITEVQYDSLIDPFLSVSGYDITTRSGTTETSQHADVSYRPAGNDTADLAGYIMIAGVPYMAVTIQDRPNLEIRNGEYHPIWFERAGGVIHGISRVVGHTDSQDDIRRKLTERLSGKEIRGLSQLGVDYPTAGHSAERVQRYIGEIDATDSGSGETLLVSIDDILDLARTGNILDSRLTLSANLIKLALSYQTLDDFDRDTIEGFEKMVRSGSRIFAQLASANPLLRDLHIHCLQFPEYRRRILYAEQELGAASFDFVDESEKGFFDASISVFANPQNVTDANPEQYLLYLVHDFDHYRMGEFIPWYRDESGKLQIRDKDTYIRMMAWTEAEAVYYSDVVTPGFIGIDRFEQIINPDKNPKIISLGRAFRDMNISGPDARRALIEIERDGVIPDMIKNNARFSEFKELFVGRMLRFHVLDAYQAGYEYKWWQSHEHVAEVMLRFGITHNDPDVFVAGFDHSIEMLAAYKEGFNPLRAELARMINIDIRTLALKIAYVMDCSRGNPRIQSWANKYLDDLESSQALLREAMARVRDTNTSVTNLHAYQLIATIRASIESIRSTIQQPGFIIGLSPEQKTAFHDRIFPYFKPYESLDPSRDPMKSALIDLQQKNGIA